MSPLRRSGEPDSKGDGPAWPPLNYLSFVVRVRIDNGDDAGAEPEGSYEGPVRVEYVNGNEVRHFKGLERALQFITETVTGRQGQP